MLPEKVELLDQKLQYSKESPGLEYEEKFSFEVRKTFQNPKDGGKGAIDSITVHIEQL